MDISRKPFPSCHKVTSRKLVTCKVLVYRNRYRTAAKYPGIRCRQVWNNQFFQHIYEMYVRHQGLLL